MSGNEVRSFEKAIACLGLAASAVHESNAALLRSQGKGEEAKVHQEYADELWAAIKVLAMEEDGKDVGSVGKENDREE